MKLTSIEIGPINSEENIVLSFRDPNGMNPYNVKAIVGLDADEIVPRYYGGSGSSKMYNVSLEKREIVIKIGLNPEFTEYKTYSDLRDDLYKMIASTRTGQVQVLFKHGINVIAGLTGFVLKYESQNFDRLQEVQLTIKANEPMLKALEPVNIDVSDLDPANTVVTDSKSTAPHGVAMCVLAKTALPSISVTDPNDSSWVFTVTPQSGFLANDIVCFSSEHNDRYVYVRRMIDGVETVIYMADSVIPGSVWPVLFPGDNAFSISTPTEVSWDTISYYPTYWGV